MEMLENFFTQIPHLLKKAWAGNEVWQFAVSGAILVVGFILLEVFWRLANRRVRSLLEKRGSAFRNLDLLAFLPAFRLACAALLLGGGAAVLNLPEELRGILYGVEVFFLALAAIFFLFQLIRILDCLRLALPPQLAEKIPEKALRRLKGILRITVLIVVAGIVISTQKESLPPRVSENPWWRYFLVFAVIAATYFCIYLVGKFLSGMTSALADLEEKTRLRLVLQAAIWPLRLLLTTGALYAVKFILFVPPEEIEEGKVDWTMTANQWIDTLVGVLATLAVVFFIYRLVDVLEYELKKIADKPDTLIDQTFAQMIRTLAHVLVIVIGGIYLVRAVSGKPMSALLAGLGIGGLAVALAAQDTLKNFFGSLMIAMDRPFKIGQRVIVDKYDGVVEEIGWRSTRIRTLTGHLVTVPNEKLATNSVENIGHRPSIRRLSNITIAYDTPPEKVEKAVNIIQEILKDHEGMHPDFPPRVYFNEFNDASLNLLMIYWYFPPNYWDFCAFSERVNMQILRSFEKEGIEFAFPTVTTYLAQDSRRPLHITLSGDSSFPRFVESHKKE